MWVRECPVAAFQGEIQADASAAGSLCLLHQGRVVRVCLVSRAVGRNPVMCLLVLCTKSIRRESSAKYPRAAWDTY